MDSIVVNTAEDMDQIMTWVCKYLAQLPESNVQVKFDCPFLKGEVVFSFADCRLEFEYEGEGYVRFKSFCSVDLLGEILMGGFRWNVGSQLVTDEWYSHDLETVDVARYQERDQIYLNYAFRWFALMLLAIYYRPEFERKRHVTAVKKKKGKAKKDKSVKTLSSRKYIISGDFVDDLPKPPRRHSKPEREYGVRGHYRHYKSGKVVWIQPHTRCKGRKQNNGSTYIARVEDSKAPKG